MVLPKKNTATVPEPIASHGYLLRYVLLLTVLAFLSIMLVTLMQSFRRFDYDRYDKETDLSQRHIRPGLNIDNLPIVKIDYGKYRPNENMGNDDNSGKGEGSRVFSQKEKMNVRRQTCLSKGYYLGEKNDYINCAQFCNVSSDEEVQYLYLEKTTNVLNGRKPMRAGAWCLPKKAANCNYNTSILVYSINGWLCLPRSDAFSGEGGNRIVVCNGSLWDNALHRQYDTFIPSNLSFNDVYNDKLSNGQYRFICPLNLRDDIKNKFVVLKYNRLHLLRNWCLEDIPFGKDGSQPDLETGRCRCTAPYTLNDRSGKCTSCALRFDVRSYTSHLYNRPCFSLRDYPSFLPHLRQLMGQPEKEVLLPCGLSDGEDTNNELIKPRCLDTAIQVYNPLLASANTLKKLVAVL